MPAEDTEDPVADFMLFMSISNNYRQIAANVTVVGSLFTVGSIVIWHDSKQAQEITITVRCGPACLGDAHRVNCIDTLGWPDAGDLLPLDAMIPVQLVPCQVADFVEGIQGCMALGLL